MTPEERIEQEVNEYRKNQKRKQISRVTSIMLALALLGICIWIFFYAMPSFE
jgi:predicted nucleic acid-binding Zn ribbon protein